MSNTAMNFNFEGDILVELLKTKNDKLEVEITSLHNIILEMVNEISSLKKQNIDLEAERTKMQFEIRKLGFDNSKEDFEIKERETRVYRTPSTLKVDGQATIEIKK